jgi:hypothetical protein
MWNVFTAVAIVLRPHGCWIRVRIYWYGALPSLAANPPINQYDKHTVRIYWYGALPSLAANPPINQYDKHTVRIYRCGARFKLRQNVLLVDWLHVVSQPINAGVTV